MTENYAINYFYEAQYSFRKFMIVSSKYLLLFIELRKWITCMKKIFVLILSSFLLTACGVEIETEEASSGDNQSSSDITSLAAISGVWNLSSNSDKNVDEDVTEATPYLFITESGQYNTYVYIDWSEFDKASTNTANCYFYEEESIADLGDGSFEVINNNENTAKTTTFKIAEEQLMHGDYSYSKSSLEESDLTPLCEV